MVHFEFQCPKFFFFFCGTLKYIFFCFDSITLCYLQAIDDIRFDLQDIDCSGVVVWVVDFLRSGRYVDGGTR